MRPMLTTSSVVLTSGHRQFSMLHLAIKSDMRMKDCGMGGVCSDSEFEEVAHSQSLQDNFRV